jgi:hypothetical protein
MVSNERIEGAINIFFVKDANNGAIATGALFGDPFPSVTISNTTVSNGVTWSTFNSVYVYFILMNLPVELKKFLGLDL